MLEPVPAAVEVLEGDERRLELARQRARERRLAGARAAVDGRDAGRARARRRGARERDQMLESGSSHRCHASARGALTAAGVRGMVASSIRQIRGVPCEGLRGRVARRPDEPDLAHTSEGRPMSAMPIRRSVRHLAAPSLAVLAALAAIVASTRRQRRPTAPPPHPPATVKIALDYTANVNYLGIYVAKSKGYFAAQGINAGDPPLRQRLGRAADPGRPDRPRHQLPAGRHHQHAPSGLAYKAVGALVTDNTTALAVLASSKYTRPAQLSGKLYGGFGIASRSAAGHGDPARRRRREAGLQAGRAQRRRDHGARRPPRRLHGGVRRHRRRDGGAAGRQAADLPLQPLPRTPPATTPTPCSSRATGTSRRARPILARALRALAEGYEYRRRIIPAAAEQILIADNHTALGNAKKIVVATGNATAPHFLDKAGVWGPETDADYAGLERILAGGHVIKSSPALGDLYTNALLPSG